MRNALTVGLAIGLAALAQVPQHVKTGPAVGEKVPEFSAPDQNGHTQNLASVMGPKGLMLVFFRSADW